MPLQELIDRIEAQAYDGKRRLVALVGPPASGKSTLAKKLAAARNGWQVVPMDGFHLDNRLLEPRGLLARKGAPETFDAAGFLHLIKRLKGEDDVIFPLFDRETDQSVAGAGQVGPQTQTVIVEGNYLLLDLPGWRDLAAFWDLSIRLDVSEAILRARLMKRWLDHGHDTADAAAKTDTNDMPNAMLVGTESLDADITLSEADLAAIAG